MQSFSQSRRREDGVSKSKSKSTGSWGLAIATRARVSRGCWPKADGNGRAATPRRNTAHTHVFLLGGCSINGTFFFFFSFPHRGMGRGVVGVGEASEVVVVVGFVYLGYR